MCRQRFCFVTFYNLSKCLLLNRVWVFQIKPQMRYFQLVNRLSAFITHG